MADIIEFLVQQSLMTSGMRERVPARYGEMADRAGAVLWLRRGVCRSQSWATTSTFACTCRGAPPRSSRSWFGSAGGGCGAETPRTRARASSCAQSGGVRDSPADAMRFGKRKGVARQALGDGQTFGNDTAAQEERLKRVGGGGVPQVCISLYDWFATWFFLLAVWILLAGGDAGPAQAGANVVLYLLVSGPRLLISLSHVANGRTGGRAGAGAGIQQARKDARSRAAVPVPPSRMRPRQEPPMGRGAGSRTPEQLAMRRPAEPCFT